jgi:hypothetical protein
MMASSPPAPTPRGLKLFPATEFNRRVMCVVIIGSYVLLSA